jgi:hypothetical protein
LTATTLLEYEAKLRDIVGARSTLVAALDGYHAKVDGAKCTGCARNAAGRVLVAAFVDSIEHADTEVRSALAETLSAYTIIQGQQSVLLQDLLTTTPEVQDAPATI